MVCVETNMEIVGTIRTELTSHNADIIQEEANAKKSGFMSAAAVHHPDFICHLISRPQWISMLPSKIRGLSNIGDNEFIT